jgi:SpoVK/Ycf46/Vps4 family AAA+-type ATPase
MSREKIMQINNWEEELNKAGVLQEEGAVAEALSEEQDEKLSSKLLTLLALSRLGRNPQDSLAVTLLEKALTLNPDHKQAREALVRSDWQELKGVLDTLTFPAIRETDNRTAKKKVSEHYIDVCKVFLKEGEKLLPELEDKLDLASTMMDKNIFQTYRTLYELLTAVINETSSLLKAAEEYDQSITGVFHTATYYEALKYHLSNVEDIKTKWQQVFDVSDESAIQERTALDKLHGLIGMESVKKRVNDFYRFLKYQQQRKNLGFATKDEMSLNMILTGNPGTGKTTLARLLAKIYHELGVLPREEVIETNRSQLVGSFVGQTEENVRMVVERAVGGVLFIDEAYSLKREGQSGNDYGQAAVDTLVSLMTSSEYGGKFAVILAGYPEEMRTFVDANPGLRSRFPQSNLIQLPNYSNEELIQIAEVTALDNDYYLTAGAKLQIDHRLDQERVDDTFGNARTVRNIVLDAIFKKGSDTAGDGLLDYMLLTKADFTVVGKESTDSPIIRLNNLIGLDTLKTDITSLISFVKMQQFRRNNGLPTVPIQLHSVFTGNPGTGKTTVAKIYSELLKECGLLKRGHLIVSSRADFVAGYVGQTAEKTKSKIREALGGVLFIDEAYSLLGQTSADFGKEVIDTLVDEMTKSNENLVVILAGYPNEMNELLESNPGLRSRFKKFFYFPDYNAEELLQIIVSYGESFQYHLTEEAKQMLLETMERESFQGNGRFATNLVDEMIQAQAARLMSEEPGDQLLEHAMILDAEDVNKAINKIVGVKP